MDTNQAIQTPIADHILNWLIFGNRENYKKPLTPTIKDPKERQKYFNDLLPLK